MSVAPGGSGSVVLAFAGKNLVFAPETIQATIEHFQGVLDKIAGVKKFSIEDFTGEPAGLDFASENSVKNLRESAAMLQQRMSDAAVQVQAAIDNLQANGTAYVNSDVAPAAPGTTA